MHLLVTEGAVLEARTAQVVERRRHRSQRRVGRRNRHRQVGVALQAHQAHLLPRQHARIRRAVRLMAGAAAFEAHRSVLEGKGSHLIAVALGAAGFVGARRLDRFGQRAAVRIVAIHAGHGAFRQPVLVGALETGPDVGVAAGAQRVDVRRLARHQAVRSVLVNRVAGRAAHLVLGMTAVDTSRVGSLILMAGEADAVGFGGLQFGGLSDVGGGRRFGVLAARPVADSRRPWFPSRVSYRFPPLGEGSSGRR